MERNAALALLDLSDHATETQVLARAEAKRADLEERLVKAPIMALKAKYRNEIERVKLAQEVLTAEVTGGSDFDDLPVGQKIDFDSMPQAPAREAQAAGGANGHGVSHRPPERRAAPEGHATDPDQPATFSGRRPPERRSTANGASRSRADLESDEDDPRLNGGSSRRPPPRPSPEKQQRTRVQDPVEDEYLDEESRPPARQREPMRPGVFWSLVSTVVLVAGGASWAAWQYWWVPGKLAQNAEAAHRALSSVGGDVNGMPMQGELVHARARALCQMAIAMGSTGHSAEASSFISEATNLVNQSMEGATKNEDYCRVIAAQAAAGNTQAAISALMTMQADREKVDRRGKPAAANAPPSRTPVHEDLARRAIAIAQARQGQPDQAMRLVEGISQNNDVLACEALAEIARQFLLEKEKAQAVQTLQTLETRAKRVSDPARRAPLLTFVAERMHAMQGSTQAKQWVSDALSGITSGSGGSSSGYPDFEARKAIAQALMLPTLLRAGGEQKDSYRKKVEDVSALAANLQSTMGAISGQPDFQNRAIAYAHVAVAWHELAKRWFAGDAKQRAEDAVAKARQAAEQVRPPAQMGNDESTIDKKEEALVPIINALAVMQDFDQARRLSQTLTLAENQGPAAEAVAYNLGQSGLAEEGQNYVRSLTGGEPRIRAAIGLHYGLQGLPLEKWW